jgi:oligopeptide/dipeptide ABC transporter ATP-binding protein
MSAPVLAVADLAVDFVTHDGTIHAVNGVSFELFPGETLGIVGESGSGKSVSVLSLLGLVPMPPGRIVAGSALFDGEDLLTASARRLRALRGSDIAVVFQDPDTALNPVFTIGNQLVEAIRVNDRSASRRAARARAVELLDLVGISEPAARLKQYPFEFSGGMRQRVMIAIAIANRPRVLIADEPTTALDVTVQAQILEVLMLAQQETGAATILITHDLGVIAETADRVVVMYAGKVVETATSNELFERPLHPYTEGLLASRPSLSGTAEELFQIAGSPPFMLGGMPPGCAFAPRCHRSRERQECATDVPLLTATSAGRGVACHFWSEAYQEISR